MGERNRVWEGSGCSSDRPPQPHPGLGLGILAHPYQTISPSPATLRVCPTLLTHPLLESGWVTSRWVLGNRLCRSVEVEVWKQVGPHVSTTGTVPGASFDSLSS